MDAGKLTAMDPAFPHNGTTPDAGLPALRGEPPVRGEPAVRFVVEAMWDLAARGGLLVPGVLQAGAVQRGAVLWAEGSNQSVRVLGVEFPTPKGGLTLLIDRRDGAAVQPGTVLTDSPSAGLST